MPFAGSFASPSIVQAVLDAIPTPVFVKDRRHRVRLANRAFLELLGRPPPELASGDDGAFFAPEEVQVFQSADRRVFETGELLEYEEVIERADAGRRIFLTRKSPLRLDLPDGASEMFVVAVSSEVTSIRRAEHRARRAELERAAELGILETMAKGAPLGTVLETITTTVEIVAGEALSSIMLHDQAGNALHVAAAPNMPVRFLQAVDGLPVGPANGSCGRAAATKTQVIVSDIANDPLWKDYRALALQNGLRACCSTPVVASDGTLLGCFATYYSEPREPDPETLAFLARISHLAAIAIEQSRRAEELSAAETRFRQLADTIDEVFWLADAEGARIDYVSPAYEKIWGRPAESLYDNARAWLDAIHPEDRAQVLRLLARHREGFEVEYRIVRPDGEVRWINDRVFPVREGAGKVQRTAGVARDITAVKLAELALRESEERFRIVARTTADLVVDWNLETGDLWVGADGARNILGYEEAETIATADFWLSKVHPDDLHALTAAVEALADSEGGATASVEYRIAHRDGRWVRLVGKGQVLRNPLGRGRRLIASANDVTEQRDLQEQLMRAQRMEAVGQLTGGVAHDFNNLLTAVIGSAEALSMGLEDRPHLREAADLILEAAERGSELVRQLLAFSRKQALAPEVVSCSKLLDSVAQMARRTFTEAIEIVSEVESPDLRCTADLTQLTSAMLNLCINARDAMPEGGRLTIAARRQPCAGAGKPQVVLSVADTGAGMTPETRARALEPFFTTKPAGKGSGLGLSMVYGFVTQSGGRLEIESEPGRGSTIRIILDETNETPPQAAEEAPVLPHPRRRLLLVEDDRLVRVQLERQLASLGYDVTSASCGREAIDRLSAEADVDLLLTDVVMPGGMNGRQLADHARLLRPELRVVFMSGHTDDAIITSARLGQSAAFLAKPYRRADLAKTLEEAFRDDDR